MLRRSVLWSDPTIKPLYGTAEIDWTHPLTKGLVACWLFNEQGGDPRDMAGARRGVINDRQRITWICDGGGHCLLTTSSLFEFAPGVFISPALASGTSWSWDAYLRPNVTCEDYGTILTEDAAAGIWFRGTSAKISFFDTADRLSTTAITFDTLHHYAITLTASTVDHYLDGKADGSHSGLSGASRNLNSMFNDQSSDTYAGTCHFQRVWNRQLSAGEVLWLAKEPYAMFRPIVRRRYFVPAVVAAGANLMGRRVYILP